MFDDGVYRRCADGGADNDADADADADDCDSLASPCCTCNPKRCDATGRVGVGVKRNGEGRGLAHLQTNPYASIPRACTVKGSFKSSSFQFLKKHFRIASFGFLPQHAGGWRLSTAGGGLLFRVPLGYDALSETSFSPNGRWSMVNLREQTARSKHVLLDGKVGR